MNQPANHNSKHYIHTNPLFSVTHQNHIIQTKQKIPILTWISLRYSRLYWTDTKLLQSRASSPSFYIVHLTLLDFFHYTNRDFTWIFFRWERKLRFYKWIKEYEGARGEEGDGERVWGKKVFYFTTFSIIYTIKIIVHYISIK